MKYQEGLPVQQSLGGERPANFNDLLCPSFSFPPAFIGLFERGILLWLVILLIGSRFRPSFFTPAAATAAPAAGQSVQRGKFKIDDASVFLNSIPKMSGRFSRRGERVFYSYLARVQPEESVSVK